MYIYVRTHRRGGRPGNRRSQSREETVLTDMHCHILPFVDDGVKNMDDALLMARMAVNSGVDTIVLTPHCNLPWAVEKNYRTAQLAVRMSALIARLREAKIPLNILPGAEIFCTEQVPELLRAGRLLTLAGSDYLLTEFYFDEEIGFINQMLERIRETGKKPVIAHPERYEAVQADPEIVRHWVRSGVVVQVNKESILGDLGRGAEETSRWLLSRGLAHAVASDAHGPDRRTTDMTRICRFLEEDYNPEYADILLRRNPERICRSQGVLRTD